MSNDELIHCVRHMEDNAALCGVGDMPPALDLFTGSWQGWRLRFPEQAACPACEAKWREVALAMQKERYAYNAEVGLVP